MATLRDAWDAAKRCKERVAVTFVSINVTLISSDHDWPSMNCQVHRLDGTSASTNVKSFCEAMAWFDFIDIDTPFDDILSTELPEVLASAEQ